MMLTEKLLQVDGVTIRIDDDRTRAGNQTVGDDNFLERIVGLLSEQVE